jgi:hypothetical protein
MEILKIENAPVWTDTTYDMQLCLGFAKDVAVHMKKDKPLVELWQLERDAYNGARAEFALWRLLGSPTLWEPDLEIYIDRKKASHAADVGPYQVKQSSLYGKRSPSWVFMRAAIAKQDGPIVLMAFHPDDADRLGYAKRDVAIRWKPCVVTDYAAAREVFEDMQARKHNDRRCALYLDTLNEHAVPVDWDEWLKGQEAQWQ